MITKDELTRAKELVSVVVDNMGKDPAKALGALDELRGTFDARGARPPACVYLYTSTCQTSLGQPNLALATLADIEQSSCSCCADCRGKIDAQRVSLATICASESRIAPVTAAGPEFDKLLRQAAPLFAEPDASVAPTRESALFAGWEHGCDRGD